MSLPHIQNSVAGRNHFDPVHQSLFEVYFTLPAALRDQFAQDEAIITEHVQSISGIADLDRSPEVVQQSFMGTKRSFLAPKLSDTSFEISVVLSLNLRNGVDNYIYKLFKEWNKLGYDLSTGETRLKKDYIADWLKILVGNRQGDVFREIVFKDIIMTGLEAPGELKYDDNEAASITVKFKSDWATELNA